MNFGLSCDAFSCVRNQFGNYKIIVTFVSSSSSLSCQEECLADEVQSTSLICPATFGMRMLPVLQHGL